jgi:hypothetical protein
LYKLFLSASYLRNDSRTNRRSTKAKGQTKPNTKRKASSGRTKSKLTKSKPNPQSKPQDPESPPGLRQGLQRLTQWFGGCELDAPARESGFVRRKPKKITPLLFLQGAVALVSQSAVSLSRWAALLGVIGALRLSKQSLWGRINLGAVAFFRHVLAMVIGQRVQGSGRPVPKALTFFNRVLIQDSTTLKLIAKLAALFPGSHNQCGNKNGQLKIQAIYELLTQRFISFSLSGFTRNDQAAASDVLSVVQAGDLILRDLGYFVAKSFECIANAGAFFLSRLRLDVKIYDPITRKELNLLGQLRRYGRLDRNVLLGGQMMPVRLVAMKLPEAVAAERRRKAKQNRDKRCTPSARFLKLLGWAIFITNVSPELCSAKTVAEIYGLRWHIETLFKVWKSHFRITEVPKGSESQLLVMIYARLIFLTVLAQVAGVNWLDPWEPHKPPPRSILKIAALLGDFFLVLCFEAWNIKPSDALAVQLDYHGRYDRRARPNFVEILTKLS